MFLQGSEGATGDTLPEETDNVSLFEKTLGDTLPHTIEIVVPIVILGLGVAFPKLNERLIAIQKAFLGK